MSPPAGSAPARPRLPRVLGLATLLLAAGALAAPARRRGGARISVPEPAPGSAPRSTPRSAPGSASTSDPARGLHGAAAILAASVLADSAIEHTRANFANPGMVTPLLASSAALLAAAHGACADPGRQGRIGAQRARIYGTALVAGAAGTAFHLYNLLARPGGITWSALFWGAPLGAPGALALAGLLGLGAHGAAARRGDPRLSSRRLGAVVGAGIAGASAEAALLHFRGAYQNPFMWLPVTVPPTTALLLGLHAAAPTPARRRRALAWLRLTGALGLGGVGFHAWGLHRRMGGWSNLRQNLMSGPPLAAPPAFAALALGGLATLALPDRAGGRP